MMITNMKKKPIELYIHIPFCVKKCDYCDFLSFRALSSVHEAYVQQLIREIRAQSCYCTDCQVVSVFIGGGTPFLLEPSCISRIMETVFSCFQVEPEAEITTEANPDTVDERYIGALAEGGFTRVSFGMQSAVPHVLKTLDRTHTPANVEAGVRAADRAGLRSSVDLIYGAPGESLDDWHTSVRTAIDLGVNHISAYALTIAPNTKMGRRIAAGTLSRPDDDDEANKYEIADTMFTEAGLEWYEISNWARPGYESQHNLGYWRNVDWAGLGPGAHSHYGDCEDGKGLRSWDIAHPRLWGTAINEGNVPWAGSERITADEDIEETIMLGLRIREGLDTRQFSHLIPEQKWIELEHDGLITMLDGRAIPTLRGRLLNDTIITELLETLD